MVERAFGEAGDTVVVEEFLEGEEASFIAITDGKTILPLATSQDHKAIFDGDTGPNTGGMGAYSPAPVVTPEMETEVMETVMAPVVKAMAGDGTPFKGILYAGLMITPAGIKVLEFNCRLGDPETQPILMRMENDLYELLLAASETDEYSLRSCEQAVRLAQHRGSRLLRAASGHGAAMLDGKKNERFVGELMATLLKMWWTAQEKKKRPKQKTYLQRQPDKTPF